MKISLQGQEFNIEIWNKQKIGSIIAFDCETTVTPFHMTPELVTIQAYGGGDTVYYVKKEDVKLFFNFHYESKFIMHNFSFDVDVLSKYLDNRDFGFDLIDRDKIIDTSILWRLLHLAEHGFIPFKMSLAFLSEQLLGHNMNKDTEVRCNYEQYIDSDILDIPTHFLEYGALDVVITMKIYLILSGMIIPHDKMGTQLSHNIQVKGSFALNHIYKNGIGFNLKDRDDWLVGIDAQMEVHADILATWGWCRGTKGIKDRMESILDMLGIKDKLPTTKTGISTKGEDLEPYKDLAFVNSYLSYQSLEKAKSFVSEVTSSRLHPRYNALVNTGRVSCSKPNFQQLPRLGGIREMFTADKGNTLLITDYSTLELAALAQVMFVQYGKSIMKDKINNGDDLHKYYASVMHGCEMKDVTKDMRQQAKAANFGFPGGLGITTFRTFAKGYGLNISEEDAKDMKDVWHDSFPETREYLSGEKGEVTTLTGRKRGRTTFCAEKNTPFQGLSADGAKLAMYELDKLGFKIVGFVHDEIICEVPKEDADKMLIIQEKVMIDSMRVVIPDVKIAVESQISDFYTK